MKNKWSINYKVLPTKRNTSYSSTIESLFDIKLLNKYITKSIILKKLYLLCKLSLHSKFKTQF